MKAKKRSFRPALQQVEDRVVLSFSFSNLLHTLFPGFSKPQVHHPAKHPTAHAATPKVKHPAVHAATPVVHAHAPAHPKVQAHGIHAMKHPAKS
jgi:hypothetical protein